MRSRSRPGTPDPTWGTVEAAADGFTPTRLLLVVWKRIRTLFERFFQKMMKAEAQVPNVVSPIEGTVKLKGMKRMALLDGMSKHLEQVRRSAPKLLQHAIGRLFDDVLQPQQPKVPTYLP